jgi:uncharacterized protein HemY
LRQQPGRSAEAEAEREIFERIRADRLRLTQIAAHEMSKRPFDPNLHHELGMLWYRNGKVDAGLRWLKSALILDPTHQATLQALAEHFKRVGDSGNAEKYRPEPRSEDAKKAVAPP